MSINETIPVQFQPRLVWVLMSLGAILLRDDAIFLAYLSLVLSQVELFLKDVFISWNAPITLCYTLCHLWCHSNWDLSIWWSHWPYLLILNQQLRCIFFANLGCHLWWILQTSHISLLRWSHYFICATHIRVGVVVASLIRCKFMLVVPLHAWNAWFLGAFGLISMEIACLVVLLSSGRNGGILQQWHAFSQVLGLLLACLLDGVEALLGLATASWSSRWWADWVGLDDIDLEVDIVVDLFKDSVIHFHAKERRPCDSFHYEGCKHDISESLVVATEDQDAEGIADKAHEEWHDTKGQHDRSHPGVGHLWERNWLVPPGWLNNLEVCHHTKSETRQEYEDLLERGFVLVEVPEGVINDSKDYELGYETDNEARPEKDALVSQTDHL